MSRRALRLAGRPAGRGWWRHTGARRARTPAAESGGPRAGRRRRPVGGRRRPHLLALRGYPSPGRVRQADRSEHHRIVVAGRAGGVLATFRLWFRPGLRHAPSRDPRAAGRRRPTTGSYTVSADAAPQQNTYGPDVRTEIADGSGCGRAAGSGPAATATPSLRSTPTTQPTTVPTATLSRPSTMRRPQRRRPRGRTGCAHRTGSDAQALHGGALRPERRRPRRLEGRAERRAAERPPLLTAGVCLDPRPCAYRSPLQWGGVVPRPWLTRRRSRGVRGAASVSCACRRGWQNYSSSRHSA